MTLLPLLDAKIGVENPPVGLDVVARAFGNFDGMVERHHDQCITAPMPCSISAIVVP
jgi:hypothetical protein